MTEDERTSTLKSRRTAMTFAQRAYCMFDRRSRVRGKTRVHSVRAPSAVKHPNRQLISRRPGETNYQNMFNRRSRERGKMRVHSIRAPSAVKRPKGQADLLLVPKLRLGNAYP